MGVDICAIMKHKLTANEIYNLPTKIVLWTEVLDFFNEHNKEKIFSPTAKWDESNFRNFSMEEIEKEWNGRETKEGNPKTCRLLTDFADFHFNRKTVVVCPSPHHKYGNLYHFYSRNYVLKLLRLIGIRLETNKIIYGVDSACSTCILEEKAREGLPLEEIESYGLSRFGKIPKNLTEAVYNYFFIDDFEMTLEDYDNDPFLFNRCNEEYFLEKKFNQNFIIYRE